MVGASKWIGNANGEYKWNLSNGFEENVTASYAFRSKAVGTVEDSDFGQIPSYAVVNLSTGLRGDFKQGQWDVSLWLKNAFDKTSTRPCGPLPTAVMKGCSARRGRWA